MCEPTMIMMAAGTLLSAGGQLTTAKATSDAGKHNAKVMDMNAKLAERRARDAIERGTIEEQRKRQEVAGIKGQQQAAMAANGVDLSFGSPLDLIVDTAVMGELDALTIRSNTYREAYEHRVDATNKRAGAAAERAGAKSALTAGYLNAAGTVLTGAGKAYGRHYGT